MSGKNLVHIPHSRMGGDKRALGIRSFFGWGGGRGCKPCTDLSHYMLKLSISGRLHWTASLKQTQAFDLAMDIIIQVNHFVLILSVTIGDADLTQYDSFNPQ